MFDVQVFRRSAAIAVVTVSICAGGVKQAAAQGFISPIVGYNFGGDAGCPEITNCDDKHVNYGVGFGALGKIVGVEGEVAYTSDFFGKTPNQSSNVLIMMGNFLLAPKIGPVQPYGLAGLGVMRTSVETAGINEDQNEFSWDAGGGLMIFFGQHIGIRGDIRYFHAFQVLNLLGLQNVANLNEKKVDFGRAAFGLVFKF